MILTLTLNPAIDLTYTMPTFVPGTTNRVQHVLERAGGKGVNVARVLIAQGHEAMVLAPVGGVVGEQFRSDLRDAAIPHRLTPVRAPTRRTITVVTPDHTTPINEAGQAPTAAELEALLSAVAEELPRASVLVCSGSVPPGSPADLLPRVVALARTRGVPVLVDTSGPALVAAAEAGADVLTPNREELLHTAPEPPPPTPAAAGSDLGLVVPASRELAARTSGTVFTSLGQAGMLALTQTGPVWHARLDEPLAGNPTGAGDAAAAAIAVAMTAKGWAEDEEALKAALHTATAWSAAAVLTPNAGSIADPAPLAERITLTPVPAEEHP